MRRKVKVKTYKLMRDAILPIVCGISPVNRLLLKELNKTKTISVKRFYLKRILRIWPLYFLLVFLGVVALPFVLQLLGVSYKMPYTINQTWYYFVFFLPGLVTYYFGHHLLEPLWSIGV